ncbi:helix-turn-helix transcriptional regulator [Cohnella sp.]|uniref:AraC family transcriptional regulator n=1 Tax=Cohnella sp. TaxID=1883426 RepID=UPI0035655DCD
MQIGTKNLEGIFDEFKKVAPRSALQTDQDVYSIPERAGEGTYQRTCLRSGMEISWFDANFRDAISLDVDVQYPHLEIAYTWEGQGSWEQSGDSRNYALTAGTSSLLYIRDDKVHAELSPRERMLHMEIRMDMRCLNMQLPELSRLLERRFFCRQTAGAPQIRLIAEQMKQCPYSGSLRKLYLEGKTFELLAIHLDDAGIERQPTVSKLTAGDIRCLYEAKEILSRRWRQPPGLLELARLSGLNDYKLKLGFKELFGTTVFGYVRGMRMNEARKILEQGRVGVNEAAILVGYHNFSHFAALFRKTYGYNPSEVRKVAGIDPGQAERSENPYSVMNNPFPGREERRLHE